MALLDLFFQFPLDLTATREDLIQGTKLFQKLLCCHIPHTRDTRDVITRIPRQRQIIHDPIRADTP